MSSRISTPCEVDTSCACGHGWAQHAEMHLSALVLTSRHTTSFDIGVSVKIPTNLNQEEAIIFGHIHVNIDHHGKLSLTELQSCSLCIATLR